MIIIICLVFVFFFFFFFNLHTRVKNQGFANFAKFTSASALLTLATVAVLLSDKLSLFPDLEFGSVD